MRRSPLFIDLDFSPNRRVSSWLGWALLTAGGLAVGFVIAEYRAEREKILEGEQAIVRLRESRQRPPSAPTSETRRAVSNEEALAALDIAKRLNAQWGSMFAALASAQSDSVSWIRLDAEPASGRLRIVGEARSLPSAFDFMTHLGSAEGVGDVSLSSYERMQTGSVELVRFNVNANWGSGR